MDLHPAAGLVVQIARIVDSEYLKTTLFSLLVQIHGSVDVRITARPVKR